MKKIMYFFLLAIISVSMSGCNSKTYSFKDMTGFEITDIEMVSYSNGPLQSLRVEFQGDYSKFLDVKYKFVGKDEKAINKFEEVRDNHNFIFDVELIDSNENIYFYVYENKIYFADGNVGLYVSAENVSLLSLKIEAERK